MFFDTQKSIVQLIDLSLWGINQQGLELFIKRDDLIDREVSGNKWRKLKYFYLDAKEKGFSKWATFGGAFSNHIAATAAFGKKSGMETIGFIRGEESSIKNSTLTKAHENGMKLVFLNRKEYKEIRENGFKELEQKYPQHYFIPEGGYGILGTLGCKELVSEINQEFDYIACACGTSTTLAGISRGLSENQKAIGFPVLKEGNYLWESLKNLNAITDKIELQTSYHFGGYAKINTELVDFIHDFYSRSKIPLDLVYTGKMMFGLFDLIRKNHFQNGTKILTLHTGGLQGNEGYRERVHLSF